MTIRGSAHLRRAAQRVRGFFQHRALILLYHRVASLRSDPWSLAVTPAHFGEHVEILRRYARPARLQQLTRALAEGKTLHRSVVVTFDDGYADNLVSAKPLLERHDVPATVFVATGAIGGGREFWWDELGRVLLEPGTLPAELDVRVDETRFTWTLGEAAHYDQEAALRDRHWRAGEEAPSARHALYRALWERLRCSPAGARERTMNELLEWSGVGVAVRPSHRTLSSDDVAALANGGLVDVGAHTVTHPMLSALSAAAQRDEIERSKTRLDEILDRPVTSFSYPYGGRADFSRETVDAVRHARFHCACSTHADTVARQSDPYQLPRVYVGDWDGDRFAECLSQWLPVTIR